MNSFSVSTTSTLTTTQATSLPLQQFAAFGNNSNDCSVRFSSTKHAQTGYWTCAARISKNDSFISTQPAKLSIAKTTKGLFILLHFFLNPLYLTITFGILSNNDLQILEIQKLSRSIFTLKRTKISLREI